jgi:hypothetical protein
VCWYIAKLCLGSFTKISNLRSSIFSPRVPVNDKQADSIVSLEESFNCFAFSISYSLASNSVKAIWSTKSENNSLAATKSV